MEALQLFPAWPRANRLFSLSTSLDPLRTHESLTYMRRAAFLSLEDRPVLNLYNNEMKRLEGAPLGKDPLVIPKNHRMFYTHNYPHSKRHPELLSTYSGSTKVERFHFGIDNNRLQIVDNPEGTQLLLNYYSIMAIIIRKPAPETSQTTTRSTKRTNWRTKWAKWTQ